MDTQDRYGGEAFSTLDYAIFWVVLLISLGIGIGSSFLGNRSPEEFFVGNRSLETIPVAMSLLCSFVSAVSVVGLTGEYYAFGAQLSAFSIGASIGIGVTSYVTLPVLYSLRLTSTLKYVELRFGSPNLRLLLMVITFFNGVIFMGVCLYATAFAALSAIAHFSYSTLVFIMGVVCTIYSAIGGVRAVVWTDVFQLVITVVGLVMVDVLGIIEIGGFKKLIDISREGGRLQFFNMSPSLYERHTFFNTLILGFFTYAASYGVSQINLQRICAVSSQGKAKMVIWMNAAGMLFIHLVILIGGLVSYAVYAECDPIKSHRIPSPNKILSFLIVDKLNTFPGLTGIFVSTLLASTLSTFSSIANAQVALLWEDVLMRFRIFSEAKPNVAALINKALTLVVGGAFMGMAFLTAKAGSIIQLTLSVGGILFGCIFGVFLLGMCVPTSNIKGAWSGLISSVGVLLWMYIGSLLYGSPAEPLPTNVNSCEWPEDAFSEITTTVPSVNASNTNHSLHLDYQNSSDRFSSPFEYFYGISYTFYPLISTTLCILVGWVVSHATGATPIEKVNPELITPFVRRLMKMNGSRKRHDVEMENKQPLI